jgi:hypothetical protein
MVDAQRHAVQRRPELGAKLAEELGPDRVVRQHRDRIAHRSDILAPCQEVMELTVSGRHP